jgi:asparagine synthase (glutamine-hydrolysing)
LPGSANSRGIWARARRFLHAVDLPPALRYVRWVGAFSDSDKLEVYAPEFAAEFDQAPDSGLLLDGVVDGRASELLDCFLLADTLLYLPNDLLTKVDIASMACSLEARSPFLDHRLVEFAATLPTEFKLRRGTSKYLVKRAMRGILPQAILTRPKMGFGVPVGRWLRGELRPLLEETLFSQRALGRGYFRTEGVRALVDRHVSGAADETPRIWGLLMLELWHQAFVDGSATAGAEPPAAVFSRR